MLIKVARVLIYDDTRMRANIVFPVASLSLFLSLPRFIVRAMTSHGVMSASPRKYLFYK
jgi:hypothetical protein